MGRDVAPDQVDPRLVGLRTQSLASPQNRLLPTHVVPREPKRVCAGCVNSQLTQTGSASSCGTCRPRLSTRAPRSGSCGLASGSSLYGGLFSKPENCKDLINPG